MPGEPKIWLKKGREKKIKNHYPWVQKEEVIRSDEVQPGEIAQLVDFEGNFLAIGFANPISRFPFRVLTHVDEPIDEAFFMRRIQESVDRRTNLEASSGRRIIFAEADRLPGLIVDQYDQVLVVQIRAYGMERTKHLWLPALEKILKPSAIYERSEMEGRKEEGLPSHAGIMSGELPEVVTITEDGLTFEIPIEHGLKTGFYLDQRETRRQLARLVKPGERVLDAFCYVGAFSLSAAKAGAETLGLDLHDVALEAAARNAKANHLNCDWEKANVFEWLAEPPKSEADKFDWMILDPPAIAKSKSKRDSLKWGIWKLVYHAVDHLKPGGCIVVCSCSYQLDLGEMLDTVRLALGDRGKIGFVESITLQSPDHPYLLQFPESLYLKCAWVRVP